MGIERMKFGITKNGDKVTKYILENKNGMRVSLSDLGADIVEIYVPDREGRVEDVALGFDNVSDYEANAPGFGAFIGRYANRISNAKFTLNGTEYPLDDNDNSNCLHGGFDRYEKKMYHAKYDGDDTQESITFSRVSPDMEQGFPGALELSVTYILTEENELIIKYHAVSDKDTIINLTNHTYFNLGPGGHKCLDVRPQLLRVFADEYTPVDALRIPTGEIKSVEGTALDFREMHIIGDRIGEAASDEKTVDGYDHNFVLRTQDGTVTKAAMYQDTRCGRRMLVLTDQPGLQVYSASMLAPTTGKEGVTYDRFSGICFESQNYPDAINKEGFPDAVLRAGEAYDRTTIYKFSTFE